MTRIWLRVGLIVFSLGGIALLVLAYQCDLFKLEKTVCLASSPNLQIPLNSYVGRYMGRSILDFPSADCLDKIMADFPQVQYATLKKNFRGILSFDYSLKQPYILISLDKIYALNPRGELMPATGYDFPVITGLNIAGSAYYSQLPDKYISYALKIADLLAADSGRLRRNLSAIDLSHPTGLSVFVDGCGAELILGRGNEIEKFRLVDRLTNFLKSLDTEVVSVDLRFADQLVLKKISDIKDKGNGERNDLRSSGHRLDQGQQPDSLKK